MTSHIFSSCAFLSAPLPALRQVSQPSTSAFVQRHARAETPRVGRARVQRCVPTNMTQKTPPETFEAAALASTAKASLPWSKTLLLGIVAGAYISLGGLLALRVGGSMPAVMAANPGLQRLLFGLFGLPTGLTLVVAAGGELFTGNTMIMAAGLLTKRVKAMRVLHNWFWSFLGNLVGSLLVVKLVLLSGVLAGPGSGAAAAVGAAVMKTSLPFGQAFFRGLICNWLVCLAVYLAGGASSLASKFVAIVLPISAFVAMGMEHSVANMFLIPMGIKSGAEVSMKQFFLANLLPVTLGNLVAGSVMVALVYFLAYGRKTYR